MKCFRYNLQIARDKISSYRVYVSAPVAQLDRASGYEPEGREFESLRAHHLPNRHAYFGDRLPRAVNAACFDLPFPFCLVRSRFARR